jgi:hypothetical protein
MLTIAQHSALILAIRNEFHWPIFIDSPIMNEEKENSGGFEGHYSSRMRTSFQK